MVDFPGKRMSDKQLKTADMNFDVIGASFTTTSSISTSLMAVNPSAFGSLHINPVLINMIDQVANTGYLSCYTPMSQCEITQ